MFYMISGADMEFLYHHAIRRLQVFFLVGNIRLRNMKATAHTFCINQYGGGQKDHADKYNKITNTFALDFLCYILFHVSAF